MNIFSLCFDKKTHEAKTSSNCFQPICRNTLAQIHTKDENDIINTIKEYYINNLNDIVEHITKSGNEPDQEVDLT